jgi:putative transposase
MRQKSGPQTAGGERSSRTSAARPANTIRREEKSASCWKACAVRSIAALCRREGIAESLYYNWSKEFLEAGKKRLAGDTARAATSDEVKVLRREARDLKEVVAEQALELRLLKKSMIAAWGRRRMRYPASEKLEIIRLVEQSHLPAKQHARQARHSPPTFNRWYDRFLTGGVEALEDRTSARAGVEPHSRRYPRKYHRPCA